MRELKLIRRLFLAAGFLFVSFWAAVVVIGRLPDSLEAEGRVEAKEDYPVTGCVTGILKVIHVEEGDRVSEGEVIAELDGRSFLELSKNAALEVERLELKIRKIESEIDALERLKENQHEVMAAKNEIAKAQFTHTKNVLDRKKKVAHEDLVPLTEIELAETYFKMAAERMDLEAAEEHLMDQEIDDRLAQKRVEHDQAGVEHDQALLGLEQAQADLDACRIVAPVTGIVMQLKYRPGDLLERGLRLTTMVRDGDMRFTALVNDEDMARMQLGLAAEISMDAFPHRRYGIFAGQVVAVAPGADSGGRGPLFRITVALEDLAKEVSWELGPQKVLLKPGQKGTAKIILREAMPIWNLLFDKASGAL